MTKATTKATSKPRAPRVKKAIKFPCEVCKKESTHATVCCGSDFAFFCKTHIVGYVAGGSYPIRTIKNESEFSLEQMASSLSEGKNRWICSEAKAQIAKFKK